MSMPPRERISSRSSSPTTTATPRPPQPEPSTSRKLVTALLCKDEKDKYLERVLRRCHEFSDEVLVLDDGSTDGSERLAWGLGCGVRKRVNAGMWGNEAPARAELWDWAAEVAGDGWVLICDCDMLLVGDPRPLCQSETVNSWSWVLYDCWNEERFYRQDGFWMGHTTARPWLFRPSRLGYDRPMWPARGIHTGHAPANALLRPGVCSPVELYWLHLSFMNREHRLRKLEQYMSQAHQLSPFELAHARSVGD